MPSGKDVLQSLQPSPSRARPGGPLLLRAEPDRRQETDQCEPIEDSGLYDLVKGAQSGSDDRTLIGRLFEIGESKQEIVLDLQPSTRSPQQEPSLRRWEPNLPSIGIGEQEGDLERVWKGTPQDVGLDGVLRRPEAAQEMEEIEVTAPRQSRPTSQFPSVTSPAIVPLHLIPLLPSPSPKRRRRSSGLSLNQTDTVVDDYSGRGGLTNVTGGITPSPQPSPLSVRSNLSASSTGISRTLAYAMDQMNITHLPDYLPLRDAELEDPAMTRQDEVKHEGDVLTRLKTVRFEESTSGPPELTERLWGDAVLAVATACTHEESGHKVEVGVRREQDKGTICVRDAIVNTAGGHSDIRKG